MRGGRKLAVSPVAIGAFIARKILLMAVVPAGIWVVPARRDRFELRTSRLAPSERECRGRLCAPRDREGFAVMDAIGGKQ
jgi:hypothetical protein